MKGYQTTLFTRLDEKHDGEPLSEWIMKMAKQIGFRGATILAASEGFGRSGKIHSSHIFDLTDQPQEIVLTGDVSQTEALFDLFRSQNIKIPFIRTLVEYGVLGVAEYSIQDH